MQIDHILAFNAALLIALISPRPAFLLVLRTGVSCGKSAGLALGAGQGVAAAFWTLAALAGLEGVFQLFPWAYSAVKIVGALYLMYLAWRLWKQAADPVLPFSDPHHVTAHHFTVQQISPTGGAIGGSKRIWSLTVLRSHFVHGVLINLTNPKSVMFAAVVLIVIFPPNLGLAEKAFIVGNHLALEWAFYFCLTWLVSRPAAISRPNSCLIDVLRVSWQPWDCACF